MSVVHTFLTNMKTILNIAKSKCADPEEVEILKERAQKRKKKDTGKASTSHDGHGWQDAFDAFIALPTERPQSPPDSPASYSTICTVESDHGILSCRLILIVQR